MVSSIEDPSQSTEVDLAAGQQREPRRRYSATILRGILYADSSPTEPSGAELVLVERVVGRDDHRGHDLAAVGIGDSHDVGHCAAGDRRRSPSRPRRGRRWRPRS